MEILDRRALNRALLSRQLLLERSPMSVTEALDHLVGLQAQAPNPPYVGLWARLAGFTPDRLSDLVLSREVVRIALLRGTIFLVTARDALELRPLLAAYLSRVTQTNHGKKLTGIDFPALVARGRELVEREPMTFAELGKALAGDFPGQDPAAMAQVIRGEVPLVQVPPRGLWNTSGQAAHTSLELWLGRPLSPDGAVDQLVLRYLAAFGPAGPKDAQVWSGLTRLGEVFERLPLRRFRDDQGRELFDLPDAPRPDPDTPAPVRFTGEFENTLLSYADRTRIIADEHKPHIFTVNGIFPGVFLVDGFVAGMWRRQKQTLTVTPFVRLSKQDKVAVQAEAEALGGFLGTTETAWGAPA